MEAELTIPVGTTVSPEALLSALESVLGKSVKMEFKPSQHTAEEYIYLGLWMLTGDSQLEILIDDPELYPERLAKLREKTLSLLGDILSKVLVDNEHKAI